jgi:hypothetical protein
MSARGIRLETHHVLAGLETYKDGGADADEEIAGGAI